MHMSQPRIAVRDARKELPGRRSEQFARREMRVGSAGAGQHVGVKSAFAGPTAAHYRRYRRDVPGALLDRLVEHAGLTGTAVVVDLGAGTGQVAVPLAARVGTVLAVEPEIDMLAQLRQRGKEDGVGNLLYLLAGLRPGRARGAGRCRRPRVRSVDGRQRPGLDGRAGAIAAARRGLAPGGSVAVLTTGSRCGCARRTGPRRSTPTWPAGSVAR